MSSGMSTFGEHAIEALELRKKRRVHLTEICAVGIHVVGIAPPVGLAVGK